MKRSTFLKSLLAIPVAVKALGKAEAKPTGKYHYEQEDEYGPQPLYGQHLIINNKAYDLAYLNKTSDFNYDVALYSAQISPEECYKVWEKGGPIELIHDGFRMECFVISMVIDPSIELSLIVNGEVVLDPNYRRPNTNWIKYPG